MMSIDITRVTSYSTSIGQILYLSPFLKYLPCNFDDLELAQFKIVQGQRSWCQSTARWWFFYLTTIVSNIVSLYEFVWLAPYVTKRELGVPTDHCQWLWYLNQNIILTTVWLMPILMQRVTFDNTTRGPIGHWLNRTPTPNHTHTHPWKTH